MKKLITHINPHLDDISAIWLFKRFYPEFLDAEIEFIGASRDAALKDQTESTGNAARAGFKSSPSPGTSNFYLCPGPTSRQKILNETTGLYLYDVMGLHMADPISGDFSVGAIGAWLDHGRFLHGVRGITIAGNLLDLMKNMDAVCDDLTFFGSVGSPTFRVRDLVISGS